MTETLRITWMFLENPWFTIGDETKEDIKREGGPEAVFEDDPGKPFSKPAMLL